MDYQDPPESPILVENRILPLIWKSWAPSKVSVFSWQVLLYIFPSKVNLFKLKVILELGGVSCISCDYWLKLVSHLFVTCNIWSTILYRVFGWLRFQVVFPRELWSFFEFVYSL